MSIQKKVVGHHVSGSLRAIANVKALEMAFMENEPPAIHHSDRGSQYIYHEYVNMLKEQKCKISMAKTAQDNAYAERINRTIKEEYLDYWKPKSLEQLKRFVERAVNNYNNKRPHKHLRNIPPVEFERKWFNNQLLNKPVITIFDNTFT